MKVLFLFGFLASIPAFAEVFSERAAKTAYTNGVFPQLAVEQDSYWVLKGWVNVSFKGDALSKECDPACLEKTDTDFIHLESAAIWSALQFKKQIMVDGSQALFAERKGVTEYGADYTPRSLGGDADGDHLIPFGTYEVFRETIDPIVPGKKIRVYADPQRGFYFGGESKSGQRFDVSCRAVAHDAETLVCLALRERVGTVYAKYSRVKEFRKRPIPFCKIPGNHCEPLPQWNRGIP